MAKIISYSDHMDRNSNQSSNYLIGIILVFTGLLTLIFYIGIPILIIGVIVLLSKSKKGYIFSLGIKGEREVTENLARLDNRFTVINNYRISEKGDIDHILIGPKGMFVIETKNLKGTVYFIKNKFKYIKIGRKGGVYEGTSGDPVKQANYHAKQLREKLIGKVNSKNIKLFIHYIPCIVVFTRNTAITMDESVKIPILRPSELPEYVMKLEDALNEKEQRIIEEILLN
ncbi:nuclease-related domain protein [archaeon]|nr:nuclease-related domain protein [archaeon]